MHGQQVQSTPHSVPQRHGDARQPWSVLVLLAVAQFMVILDITVVNVALPSIGADLGFAAGDLQWVVSAYVLFTGGLLLLGGRAADMLGRRAVFLAGLVVFTAASLASGLAASPGWLVGSRAAQGLGAALLLPAALSIVTTTYVGAQRTTALSIWGAIAAAGGAAGVLFGGMLTTWLSWEWVFLINVPVGAATALLAWRLVSPAAGSGGLRRLDVLGALTLVGGLVLLVYGIEETGTYGWGSARTLVLFAGAATLLAGFLATERSARQPLVPPATWRVRTLVSAAAVMLGATGSFIGIVFLGSLYLQGTLGWSALETGLAFLPLTLAVGAAARIGPRLLSRLGARVVATGGLLLLAVAATLLAAAPDEASYLPDLLPGFLIAGIATGLIFVTIQVTAMSDVGPETAGLASGLITTAHEIGAALGVAVLSAVALGTGAGTAATLGSASGYEDGLTVAALATLALAGLAAAAVPALRPASAAPASMH
jgi:EmrB/QacA subfamily drug resistance transporter